MKFNLNAFLPKVIQSIPFFQGAAWEAIKNPFIIGSQSFTRWLRGEGESDSFYLKGVQSDTFQQINEWRLSFHREFNLWLKQVSGSYQQGYVLYTQESLRALLIAQQKLFKLEHHSALYYDRRLKVLAKQIPLYAHTIEGVCHHFRQTLKENKPLALAYCYQDIAYYFIQIVGKKVSLERLQKAFIYYQDLVPSGLYQAILSQLTRLSLHKLKEKKEIPFSNTWEQEVKAALYTLRKTFQEAGEKLKENHALEIVTQVPSLQAPETMTCSRVFNHIQASLQSSWQSVQQPKTLLMHTAMISIGASVFYRLWKEDNFSSFFFYTGRREVQPFFKELSGLVNEATVPFVMSYLNRGYALHAGGIPLIGQVIFPLFTTGLMRLKPVSAQVSERWVKTLGRIHSTTNSVGNSVQQTQDGGYIVTGWTGSYDSSGDLWLSKWTANGTVEWVKILGENALDSGSSVQQTQDGGYIVTGMTYSFGAGDEDLWFSKWTANGTMEWVKTLGGIHSDSGNSVQQTQDGGYIVTGGTSSFGVANGLWLSKWTGNGTVEWVKTLGGNSTDSGNSVQQTQDGGYIVTGETVSFGVGEGDLWLSKWTANGTVEWVKTLGGNSTDSGNSVQQTQDGGYIVTGSTNSFFGPPSGIGDLLLLSKLDSFGIGGTDCLSALNVTSVVVSINSSSITVTPMTLSVLPQDIMISPQPVNPSVFNICWNVVLKDMGGSFTYIENNLPTVIDALISIDAVSNTLESAQVSIVNGFEHPEDVLGFTNQNGIAGSYNNTFGVLSLTGNASVINYQAALRNVTYSNLSENPSTETRTFSFIVNDGQFDSNSITRNATIIAVNDPPYLIASNGTVVYTGQDNLEGLIDEGIVIMDVDSPTLKNATIAITINYMDAEDRLEFTNQNEIIGSYDTVMGTLTLTGDANITFYQAALRSIHYRNLKFATDPTLSPRTIAFTVNDEGLNDSTSNTVLRNITFSTPPNTISTSPSSTTAGLVSAPNSSNGIILGIFIAVGGVILIGSSLGIGYCLYKRYQQQKPKEKLEIQATELESTKDTFHSQEESSEIFQLPDRKQPRSHTIIGERYALINSPTRQEAETLLKQTSIEITYQPNEKKRKFVLGQGQFGKLRLAQNIKSG